MPEKKVAHWEETVQLQGEQRPHEQPRLRSRHALELAGSAQGRQLPEQRKLQNKDKRDARKIDQGRQLPEQPKLRSRHLLELANSAQGRQLPEQRKLQNKDKLDARKIEQGMGTQERPRLWRRGGVGVKVNVFGKQPHEQHNGHFWKGKRFDTIQPVSTTAILNFVLGR